MPYLICRKCKGYYELQKDESLEDFESCICNGKLEYVENVNFKLVHDGNIKNQRNYKIIFILSTVAITVTVLIFLYLYSSITLIIHYSVPLAILLIVLMNLRFILNELDTDNSIIKFIQVNSIFMIIPLFILFISIIVSKIIAI